MKSVLEQLWRGNLCPSFDSHKLSPEEKEWMRYLAEHHEKLLATLNDS